MLSEDLIRHTRSAYYVLWLREQQAYARSTNFFEPNFNARLAFKSAIAALDNVLEERSDLLQGYET